MRCKNCGWPNRPEETVCTKCGSPLQSDSGESHESQVRSNQTVMEESVFGNNASQPNVCPKCGYPLRLGMKQCPNCNSTIGVEEQAQSSPTQNRQVRRPTIVGTQNFRGTVNVWTDGDIGLPPSFTLSPIKRNGEKKELNDIEFEGDSASLNRDNTDPGNLSITSRTQAIISRKDGKWFIEDKSDQKTTFVQVSSSHELHDGDIILLGNRLFIFHE
jgi:hypothetical protein